MFEPDLLLLYALPAFLIGLLLGFLIFNGARARKTLREDLGTREAELSAARDRVAKLEQEVAMTRDQVKPLADEVDRLRAMKTRQPDRSGEAGAAAPPKAREEGGFAYKPEGKLPTFIEERPENPDDLSLLKGVGPKLIATFHDMGIYYFAQIADWDDNELRMVDSKLGNFKGRIERDKLQDQAKLLAAGRVTEYEARFGKLGPAGQ